MKRKSCDRFSTATKGEGLRTLRGVNRPGVMRTRRPESHNRGVGVSVPGNRCAQAPIDLILPSAHNPIKRVCRGLPYCCWRSTISCLAAMAAPFPRQNTTVCCVVGGGCVVIRGPSSSSMSCMFYGESSELSMGGAGQLQKTYIYIYIGSRSAREDSLDYYYCSVRGED